MTLDEAIRTLTDMKVKIYIPKSAVTQRMRNGALDVAIKALEYDVKRKKKMPLICIRCKKPIHLSMPTFEEVSYTHYSYCEKCLRDALKTLKLFNEAYKKIYDHHWEILNESESESKKAKLSLSNWVLEVLSVNDEGE